MLDDTDRRILSVLQRDARASMRRISEEAGVSLGTVSNRVRRLEESGAILGYTVLLDPEMAGWELTVVIGLRIQKGRLIEIQEKIAKDPRVYGVYDVTGDFDSMVISRARDRSDLDDLSKNVMSVDGVLIDTLLEEGGAPVEGGVPGDIKGGLILVDSGNGDCLPVWVGGRISLMLGSSERLLLALQRGLTFNQNEGQ